MSLPGSTLSGPSLFIKTGSTAPENATFFRQTCTNFRAVAKSYSKKVEKYSKMAKSFSTKVATLFGKYDTVSYVDI